MAIKGYFYNAIKDEQGNYDLMYNDEDFCRYMHELIGNGVFPTPSTQLAVTANGSNMTLTVAAGEAWIEGHKVQNDADYTLTLSASDPVFKRIDRIVVYSDSEHREGGIAIVKGTAATNPVAPALTRDDSRYELCLAEVLIPAGANYVTAANLTDTRPDSNLCGWVAGLIQQVDVTTLYNQWLAAYRSLYSTMESWQENMQAQFDNWFYDLTANLNVGAYIRQFHKVVEGGDTVSNVIPLDMDGYSYESNDVFIANLNGFIITRNIDYVITMNAGVPTITLDGDMSEGNVFEITVLKSSLAKTENSVIKRESGTKFVHCEECMPEITKRFLVKYTGDTNEIVVVNRNFIEWDALADGEINGVTFTKNEDGSITIDGTTTDEGAYIEYEIDKNAFAVGKSYTISRGSSTGNCIISLSLTFSDNTTEDYYVDAETNTVTFAVEKSVISATGYIGITFEDVEFDSEVVYPQIECSLYFTEYVPGTRSTFIYDNGATLPIFTDYINNIYSTDDEVSDITVMYVLVSQPIPRELELMYYWDYAGVSSQTAMNQVADKIRGATFGGTSIQSYPNQGLFVGSIGNGAISDNYMAMGRIIEIEFGDVNVTQTTHTALCVIGFGSTTSVTGRSDTRYIGWNYDCFAWGDFFALYERKETAKRYTNLTDPNIFRNGKIKFEIITNKSAKMYINNIYIDTVSFVSPVYFKIGCIQDNVGTYAPMYIKSIKIWG